MSNTATITPRYDGEAGAEAAGEAAAAFVAAIASLAATLAATDAERAVIARCRAMARQDRLAGTRVDLRLAANGDLLGAATSLGFVDAGGHARVRLEAGRPVELTDKGGTAILLQRTGDRLAILSPGGAAVVDRVIARTVEQRAERHLTRVSGSKVIRRTLANGETELVAREALPGTGGAGRVAVRVGRGGVAHADISCVAGTRCEDMLKDMAEAIGGTVQNRGLKDDYYDDPSAAAALPHVRAGG